jgi:excisionase family DNA binding protein
MSDRNLTVREAAALVRRAPGTIRNWIYTGRLPATLHVGRLLIKESDLLSLSRPPGSQRAGRPKSIPPVPSKASK